jgi:hypothetical protein
MSFKREAALLPENWREKMHDRTTASGYAIGQKDARYGNEEPNYGRAQQGGLAAVEQARQAEIPHQLEKLECTMNGCMSGLEVLSAKLEGSVMRSEQPSPTGKDSVSQIIGAPATAIGGALQNLCSYAARLNERIASMTARLEV